MTRNLKALGLALLAVFAIGALAAQGASAAEEHEFHAANERAVFTGIDTSPHELAIGTAGTVKCSKVETENTQTGTLVSTDTYASHTITVTPRYSECTFGGNPATVNFEHCAYVFDSDTTTGNPTGGEHASVDIECAEGSSIKIVTSICTITIGAQEIKHAVRYEDDPENEKAINTLWTAHGIVVGNLGDKAGCVLVPKGAVGKYIGSTTATCYRDAGSELSGTTKTTPQGLTKEGLECELSSL